MHENKVALIVGARGGIGGETARALVRHGWQVRAFARTAPAAPDSGFEWIEGDARDRAAIVRAAAGARIIVHAVNPPGYRGWAKLVLPMIDNSIAAARASGARILLPGTIYNYGPDAWPLLQPGSPQHPATRKGRIRVALEQRLEAAASEGVRTAILRAGDFFGANAGNNWFSQGVVTPGKPVRALSYPGRPGVGHAWAYLPDLAETFARIADVEQRLPPFARYHFAGHHDASGTEMVQAIAAALGRPDLPVRRFPWWLLRLAAPFNETLRELGEMRPLWDHDIRLDNADLIALLGAEPHTPLDEAVAETLRGLGIPRV
ncbi:NAD(P)H-binding protein [Sphingosinicella sp. BN140058]|uniref:NAD(P)H-binding protein n=1 Tax=Sphingosinicella sp. BN140058 TaxID=1892855 RepID=UPI001012EA74|nr:NAD(P)H-binding protein [Sphingosinicella sp. BN140058]QAY76544.1 NAD-dependent epimerase/dehydratase family protein [Sphingosinicella sp. BN140058]